MADAGPPNARAEVVAGLTPIGAGELSTQEGRHLVRLEAVHGGANDGVVQGLKVRLATKHHVGGVLDLPEAPVIAGRKPFQPGEHLLRPPVQASVQRLGAEPVRQPLGGFEVLDEEEGVFRHLIFDPGLIEEPASDDR